MLQTLAENRYFFVAYALFLLVGGGYLIFIEKGDLLFFFNDLRTPTTHGFFRFWTQLGEEYGYFLLAFLFLFVRFRWSLLIALTGILVALFSFGLKSFFGRPRPRAFFESTDPTLLERIRFFEGWSLEDLYNNPMNSFPSGHTMSAFAFYGILALLLPKRPLLQIALFVTALLIGFSRVYLVQHFFEDIYVGSLVGVLIALGLYLISRRYPYDPRRPLDRKIGFRGRGRTTLPGEQV